MSLNRCKLNSIQKPAWSDKSGLFHIIFNFHLSSFWVFPVNSMPNDFSNAKYYVPINAQQAKSLCIHIMGFIFAAAMFWLSIIGKLVVVRTKYDGCFEE